jgi:hypothetical protein
LGELVGKRKVSFGGDEEDEMETVKVGDARAKIKLTVAPGGKKQRVNS